MLKSSNEQIGNKFDSPKMKAIAKTITEESNPVVIEAIFKQPISY